MNMMRNVWYFVRWGAGAGATDCFGKLIEEREHDFDLCVHFHEPTPGSYIPTRCPDLIAYPTARLQMDDATSLPPPRRVTFGKRLALVVAIEPPIIDKTVGDHVC